METIFTEDKLAKAKFFQKQVDIFFANWNAPSLSVRIPLVRILNYVLSGKEKTVRSFGKKVEQRKLGLLNQFGSPSRSGRQVAGILKKTCGRESLNFAERPATFSKIEL